MSAPRPSFTDDDLIVIGKMLCELDDEQMVSMGFSPAARARADGMFDDINRFMTEKHGWAWENTEVQ